MSDELVLAVARMEELYRTDFRISGPIALHEPAFEGNEWDYVKDCLDTGWVSSVGEYVDKIETMTAKICGAPHAIAVVNGTAALHATLVALGVGPGDAVICPALTFIATANAISYTGATPLFVDVTWQSLGIDSEKLARLIDQDCDRRDNKLVHRDSGLTIKSIIPVHIFGHPTDMMPLNNLAAAHNITVIEDAAEALGSQYHGQPCGNIGRAGIISFNGNKTVTSGGGGMIVTDDAELATRLKHLTTTARIPNSWWFDHDAIGFNYRMPNINAALGCAQLEQLDEFIARKRQLRDIYANLIDGLSDITLIQEPPNCFGNFWLHAVKLNNAQDRDRFLELTNQRDIQTRPCWRLIPEMTVYRDAPRDDLSIANEIVARVVNIPSGPRLHPQKSV